MSHPAPEIPLNRAWIWAGLACWIATIPALADEPSPFRLVEGDRVVLVGNTLIERDQSYGYLETLLTLLHPDRTITFRNLGWSGDTVFGDARVGFETTAAGYQRLVAHVRAVEPTVILIGYGSNEAFEGADGLPRFRDGLNRLLDDLAAIQARIVLLGPTRQENLGPPLPDPSRHNRDLRLYARAIKEVAKARGYRFIDLFEALPDGALADPPQPLTDNGIHLTAYGYWRAAAAIANGLGLEPPRWRVEIDRGGKAPTSRGASLGKVGVGRDHVRFEALDATLPAPPPPAKARPGLSFPGAERVLRIRGLDPGRYLLTIDGQPIVSASAVAWAEGVPLTGGPEFDQAERLRDTIHQKNVLYFHRWRPQNETYLFGFRKHEQGQNAREVPLFDPLVAEREKMIARLRVPIRHTYELKPESEVSRAPAF
jgi:lysophospholipase L1-like esterase